MPIHAPVLVISKTILVAATDDPDRFIVLVYVNGKLDASYMATDLATAKSLAMDIANDDCPRCSRMALLRERPALT
jgi:hypothetical protein